MPDQKREAVQRLKELRFSVVAAGDSYNDTAMLGEAHAGILFRPPEKVIKEFPQYPVTQTFAELRAEIDKAFAARAPPRITAACMRKRFYTLSGSCPDQIGIIARVLRLHCPAPRLDSRIELSRRRAATMRMTAAISCAWR
jgi:hypothetical protein